MALLEEVTCGGEVGPQCGDEAPRATRPQVESTSRQDSKARGGAPARPLTNSRQDRNQAAGLPTSLEVIGMMATGS